jgi:hypothetical protein
MVRRRVAGMKAVLILAALFSLRAWAFPEMTRHGYTHCITCHTSMSGGNLLTEYGRSLSRELLSQQTLAGKPSPEGDELFAYGLVQTPKWLTMGGDIRTLQLFVESKQASRGRFFIMQVDLDASAQVNDRFRVFGSIGRIEPRVTDAVAEDFVASPRHGVEYMFTEPEADDRVTLRAGRFMPAFGIQFAEHTLATRRLLDFNPAQERYAAELAWSNERSSVIATGILAQLDGKKTLDENGGIIQVATQVREKSKAGFNYYRSERDAATGGKYTREIYGAFAHIGFDDHWYGLLEVDRPRSAAGKWGLVEVFKLGYEVHQGWHLLGVQEYANLDLEKSNPKFESYGIGTQWFPRPHWDFYALYRRERDTAIGNDFSDVVWLIGHFYL